MAKHKEVIITAQRKIKKTMKLINNRVEKEQTKNYGLSTIEYNTIHKRSVKMSIRQSVQN